MFSVEKVRRRVRGQGTFTFHRYVHTHTQSSEEFTYSQRAAKANSKAKRKDDEPWSEKKVEGLSKQPEGRRGQKGRGEGLARM